MKIGVFDSGVGGESVANAIRKAFPELDVIHLGDEEHIPYGTKAPQEVLSYVVPILHSLVGQGCEIIVIACNTVTTTLIDVLREQMQVPLIGIEPMVKTAVELTKSGVIAVCATPTTLSSKRYRWLLETYAKGVKVLEPDCSDWTEMIETHKVNREHIHKRIDSVCNEGADVIVLGCTHYHWVEDIIGEEVTGRAQVLQPEQPVISQLRRVMAELPQTGSKHS